MTKVILSLSVAQIVRMKYVVDPISRNNKEVTVSKEMVVFLVFRVRELLNIPVLCTMTESALRYSVNELTNRIEMVTKKISDVWCASLSCSNNLVDVRQKWIDELFAK